MRSDQTWLALGSGDGSGVGFNDGDNDGVLVGDRVGEGVGPAKGASVGPSVTLEVLDQIISASWPHPVPFVHELSSSNFVQSLPP